ncbi:LysR family transcriptional regulator [Alginatibacterium sediminis]|uniref:LysR family transcriptional regulator n=1 Tax=Alginatibacterium sediminis TaxID=2164068 RepID=A0A420EI12_9ALTE|nr:LysR family transcriptional regulator [Alginatibacterium sediminis]RKF20196.1 LysR family transcriptional regulator [Alginatibacterium sediminis]
MDVKVFKTFLEVAQVKHFGKAAENLYITQAAVSARIKQLENFFDSPLFVRHRNAIKLTSSGERLVPYAETMVRTLTQAKTELAIEHEQSVQLTLAGTPNIWDAFLQYWLSVVVDAFPGYSFLAETSAREHITRALIERTLDLGVTLDPLKSDELYSNRVEDLILVLVSSKAQLSETALTDNYVYVDWGTRFASEHVERHKRIPPPILRTSNGRIALDFILEKGGCAYLPQTMVEPFLISQQLFVVSDSDSWARPVYINYRKDAANVEQIQRVERLINRTEAAPGYLIQQASEQ